MKRYLDGTIIGLTIALFAVLIVNVFLEDWMRFIVLQSLARGAVALGLLILWRAGLVSFGHALFFGFGAYTVALLQLGGIGDAFALTLAGTAVAGLWAYLIGFLLRQYRAIYFALLNLAFSMILYGVLASLESLGSTDGIGVNPPTFFGFAPIDEANPVMMFVFASVVSYAVAVAAHLYLRSTLGYMTTAVRENEIRLEYLGYSAERAIHVKYTISGLLAGLGGALMALTIGHVDPDSMVYWPVSGDFVFITILSGPGNVGGTFIGALIYELIRTYAFEEFPRLWQFIMGGSLLAIIMFLPNGLWSLTDLLRRKPAAPERP